MSDERDELILELLREIRAQLDEFSVGLTDVKARVGALEVQFAALARRVDRLEEKVERIEHHLGLIEA